MKQKIVMPGDQLSTSEELLPGDGTYEEDGIIRADRVGTYFIDSKYRRAKVKPLTSIPVIIKKGDIVLAHVANTRASMIVADVIHVIGKNRSVSGDTDGTIHVKEISPGYVKDATTEYVVGDYVRAKVIQVKPSLQLTTKDRDLGAVKALCTKCRHSLIKKGNMLECENCGNKEKRKIAIDYGQIELNKL
jgi:exosome complex component CSL4